MQLKFTIRKDGTFATEVLDREGQDCREVTRLTDQLGQKLSEEVTGPDCDTVHETTAN
jgi:hypothetical protein